MTETEYNNLPKEIKNILESYNDNKSLYKECLRIYKELNKKGYTCEYGLDGCIYDVKKINK